jgi:hypothetical protein
MLRAINVADVGDFGVGLDVFPELLQVHVLMALKTARVSNLSYV